MIMSGVQTNFKYWSSFNCDTTKVPSWEINAILNDKQDSTQEPFRYMNSHVDTEIGVNDKQRCGVNC